VGRTGEKIAVQHLRARGFTLLARNYRTRRGEIDVIAFDGTTLIFVQVKTRQVQTPEARARWSPLEWLSASQIARYRWVAEGWLSDERHTSPAAECVRFDAIGVVLDGRGDLVTLEHVEGRE
jgi:putative endonuclease